MKIYSTLKNIIREDKIAHQSQSCIKMFGKELFSVQFGGDEKNTNYENEVLRDIRSFAFTDHGPRTSEHFKRAVINLRNCMSVYPEILYPQGQLYRGEVISLKDFLKINYTPDHFNKYRFIAKSQIQSWTEDYEVGEDFSLSLLNRYTWDLINGSPNWGDEDIKKLIINYKDKLINNFKIPLVMVYTSNPDEFLFKGKYFEAITQNSGENEVLRIDERPIDVGTKIPNEVEGVILKFIDKILGYGFTIS